MLVSFIEQAFKFKTMKKVKHKEEKINKFNKMFKDIKLF